MIHTDYRIEEHIDTTTAKLIGGKDNIREFVMLDPKARFRAYKSHICLMQDLPKTIQLYTEINPKLFEPSKSQMEILQGQGRIYYNTKRFFILLLLLMTSKYTILYSSYDA